ncbi:hypothetical protein GCM10009119_27940 [Algoriphagus jejuensis]|uniref:Lipoprotein n=1 Tax=Algoriphagus jejuensis TaxID=419934 RepID=A0ABP3YGB8_9BACT
MKRILPWLIFLVSCADQGPYVNVKLFPLTAENSLLVNLDSVKTVGDLTKLYCEALIDKKKESLTLPYDFQNRTFDSQASTGIQVFAHPMYCTALSGWQRTLCFTIQDGKWMYEYYSLPQRKHLKSNLDSLVKLNILNYGLDPALSSEPQKAIFEIRTYPEKELGEIEGFIGELATAYQRFLSEEVSDPLPMDSLQIKFPLLVMISEEHDLPPIPVDSSTPLDTTLIIEVDLN